MSIQSYRNVNETILVIWSFLSISISFLFGLLHIVWEESDFWPFCFVQIEFWHKKSIFCAYVGLGADPQSLWCGKRNNNFWLNTFQMYALFGMIVVFVNDSDSFSPCVWIGPIFFVDIFMPDCVGSTVLWERVYNYFNLLPFLSCRHRNVHNLSGTTIRLSEIDVKMRPSAAVWYYLHSNFDSIVLDHPNSVLIFYGWNDQLKFRNRLLEIAFDFNFFPLLLLLIFWPLTQSSAQC